MRWRTSTWGFAILPFGMVLVTPRWCLRQHPLVIVVAEIMSARRRLPHRTYALPHTFTHIRTPIHVHIHNRTYIYKHCKRLTNSLMASNKTSAPMLEVQGEKLNSLWIANHATKQSSHSPESNMVTWSFRLLPLEICSAASRMVIAIEKQTWHVCKHISKKTSTAHKTHRFPNRWANGPWDTVSALKMGLINRLGR